MVVAATTAATLSLILGSLHAPRPLESGVATTTLLPAGLDHRHLSSIAQALLPHVQSVLMQHPPQSDDQIAGEVVPLTSNDDGEPSSEIAAMSLARLLDQATHHTNPASHNASSSNSLFQSTVASFSSSLSSPRAQQHANQQLEQKLHTMTPFLAAEASVSLVALKQMTTADLHPPNAQPTLISTSAKSAYIPHPPVLRMVMPWSKEASKPYAHTAGRVMWLMEEESVWLSWRNVMSAPSATTQ
jgi:hypothetical protein